MRKDSILKNNQSGDGCEVLVSIIIPCYCSAKTIPLVVEEVKDVLEKENQKFEIIAINDCSPDNTWETIFKLSETDERLKVINLAKNMGRHNALLCGCHYASGDYIVFMDDDMQCPADKLTNLLDAVKGDYDVAIARYPKKKQSLWKNIGSSVNDKVANWLIGKDKELKFSNYCAMRAFVKNEITNYSNPYPYLSGLIVRATQNIINIDMEERERTIGVGHYTFKKSLSLWLNSFTAFSVKPLRLATVLGCLIALCGIVVTVITIVRKILNPDILMGYTSLMASILFVGGMIMFMLGLIGEYIGRIYISLNSLPQYVVRETNNIQV